MGWQNVSVRSRIGSAVRCRACLARKRQIRFPGQRPSDAESWAAGCLPSRLCGSQTTKRRRIVRIIYAQSHRNAGARETHLGLGRRGQLSFELLHCASDARREHQGRNDVGFAQWTSLGKKSPRPSGLMSSSRRSAGWINGVKLLYVRTDGSPT